jgi:ankyrin repeat protein
MYASQVGHEESVRTLIEKGASLDEVDKEHGWTPLDWAVDTCSEEAAAVLRTHGAQHSLLFAAYKGANDSSAKPKRRQGSSARKRNKNHRP